MAVTMPEGERGRVRVERFEIRRDSIEFMRMSMRGRGCREGTFTKLSRGGSLWMSDTDAEKRDHIDAAVEISREDCRRVLINGLGLGMIVGLALTFPHVEHVDVVEIDPDVCALIGPHYTATGRVKLHCADSYGIEWPKGTRWDVAWHDIWQDLCADNLPLMTKLHRKYGRRVGWQGSWGQSKLRAR